MTYSIAVVGDRDSILPFKMIGFDIFPSRTGTEARSIMDRLAKNGYGIIYVTEQVAKDIPETIQHYKQQTIPAVILIPNVKGSLDIGKQMIQENVEKAIGCEL